MINLQQLVEKFIGQAVSDQITLRERDDQAIATLSNTENPGRSECIKEWLTLYRVFQGINAQNRAEIANRVMNFADERNAAPQSFNDRAILAEFERLRVVLHDNQREMTSLCSKVLWACYPRYVPIYDSYACRALWILSRLLEIRAEAGEEQSPYPQYFSVWCHLYERCLSFIPDEKLRGYPYKVRVFDKILWLIGQPNFETL